MENGQQLLLPTIVDGQRVTPEQALALYRMGRNDPVGAYGSQEEAETRSRGALAAHRPDAAAEGAISPPGPARSTRRRSPRRCRV